MNINRRYAIGSVAGAALALAGCGGREEDEAATTQGRNFALRDRTRLLNSANARLVAQDDSSMTVDGQLPRIAVGDVIVSTLGDGAVRRVVSVTQTSSGLRLATEAAALHEAFSRFELDYNSTLQPSDLSPTFDTGDPELELAWSAQARAQSQGQTQHPAALNGPKLNMKYKRFGGDAGLVVDGNAQFQLAPHLSMSLETAPGASIPTLIYSASINPAYSHALTISSAFGGSISMEKESREIKLGRIVVADPPIVIVPVLKISGGAKGVAAGKFSTTHTASVSGTASVRRGIDGRVIVDRNYQALATGKFDSAEGSLQVSLIPAKLELMFKFYGIGGPFFSLTAEESAKAAFERNGVAGQEGVRATSEVTLKGGIGLGGSVAFLERLLKDLRGDFELVSYEWPILQRPLADAFFPFTSAGSIVVRDNGNEPDDIFEVALDGAVLGRTSKGGTGQFRVSSLRPGTHSLRIATIEDDQPPGTWEARLSDGLRFLDGTTVKKGELALGDFVTLDVTAPQR